MVLGTAQYRRQQDASDATLVEEEELYSGGSSSIVNLAGVADGGTSDPSGAANASGGDTSDSARVKFMDSTIRYHMASSGSGGRRLVGGLRGCWKKRSRLEQALICISITLVLWAFSMILMFKFDYENFKKDFQKKESLKSLEGQICLTASCVKAAAAILSSADFQADPCDNFYQYACGRWEEMNSIPDGRTSWSMFEKLWEANQLIMKIELDRGLSDDMAEAEKKTYVYYQSCLDTNGTIEKLKAKPLLDILNTKEVGGWRILEKTEEEEPEDGVTDLEGFQRRLETLQHNYQASGFFSWNVGEDDKNSTFHIIQIDQGGLSLSTKDYYNKTDNSSRPVLEAFKGMIIKVAKLMVMEKEEVDHIDKEREARLSEMAQGIVDFETRLANITIPSSERRNESELYHKMNVSTLQQTAPFLQWQSFLTHAFSVVDRKIEDADNLVVYAPKYLNNLTDLINEYLSNSTGRLVLENYMVWHLVKSLRPLLSKEYRDAGKGLEKALLGKESHQERWRTCIADTDAVLGFALGAMFIRKSFVGQSKPVAQEMIDNVKEAFEERLSALPWMDDETKREALHKARAITDMIGYPDFILREDNINEKYEKLQIKPEEYFDNNIRYHNFVLRENLSKLDKEVNRTRWSMTPPAVNAYYTPTTNQIVFPAGILQMPFFNLSYPKSLNFGAMGVVMGHELSHAFDDQGSDYDSVGNMRNWWNKHTKQEFNSRTECMERQYSQFRSGGGQAAGGGTPETVGSANGTVGKGIAGEYVRGKQTLGENIADNGGLKAAYYAYTKWVERRREEEQPLPGIDLNHRQLFFLSFSQVWCSKSTPEAKKLQILEDQHSPAKFRVIGVLSNSQEFSEAFHCPVNSTMNPQHKCEVW